MFSWDLLRARQEQVLFLVEIPVFRTAVNRENRSEHAVDVGIRRSVDRVHQDRVLPALAVPMKLGDALGLLGHDRTDEFAVFEGVGEDFVGKKVEFFDLFTLDVGVAGVAEQAAEGGATQFVGDDLRREGNLGQDG
jgi:hypothetical protein